MTVTVIEAGPVLVRGPGTVDPELALAAVECIDDPIALIGDDPVPVDELWSEVTRMASGEDSHSLIVVCPTWWSAAAQRRVQTAAATVVADVVVVQRVQALRAELSVASWAVVEIDSDLVMVSRSGSDPVLLARDADSDVLVRATADAADGAEEVIVDAPAEVVGAEMLARAVTAELRGRGTTASVAATDSVPRAAATLRDDPAEPVPAPGRSHHRRFAVCAALMVATVCAGVALGPWAGSSGESSATLMVEGRVGVQIPAQWTVTHVTGGSGSDRVQVVSSTDPGVMIHLTQSAATPGRSVADTLGRALGEQPAGVFVDFDPADRIAGRAVVSYTELRADREIRWMVLVDKAVRIAIGCQSAPGERDTVQPACDAAVASAHAVF